MFKRHIGSFLVGVGIVSAALVATAVSMTAWVYLTYDPTATADIEAWVVFLIFAAAGGAAHAAVHWIDDEIV